MAIAVLIIVAIPHSLATHIIVRLWDCSEVINIHSLMGK